jgi:predicted nuclease of predicted toxin-antitoxin system
VRVLLDEQLPRQLARYLTGHEVRTVQQESWAGLKDGVLLKKAEQEGFSVLVTGDLNLEYQQNWKKRRLGVVVLAAPSNTLEDLLPLVAPTLAAIERVLPGQVIRVKVEQGA